MKLKIKSSARIDRRHLLIEAKNKQEIENAILEYIGVLGWAKASPIFPELFKYDFKDKIVLSINRKSLSDVRAAFELSKSGIKILRVSGTLKGLIKNN